ncbi:MAG: hypothetical protein LUD18_03320 [Lachnospiraceae bacterium]|nr:hypothetical protein [Lachnospiraceae bacterium]
MKTNPMKLMQLKGMEDQLMNSHPKLYPFLEAAAVAVDEGTVIAVEMTTSEGKVLRSNIRVSAEDMEMIRKLKEVRE